MSDLNENSSKFLNFPVRAFSGPASDAANCGRNDAKNGQKASKTEPTTPKRILVVDDEQVLLKLMTDLLGDMGYEVICATDGQEAVEIAQTFKGKIDAIILDVFMPVMSGIEALPLLQKARPGIPTVFCSGHVPNDTLRAIIESGAAGFVQKPFRVDELMDEIECALQASTTYAQAL